MTGFIEEEQGCGRLRTSWIDNILTWTGLTGLA